MTMRSLSHSRGRVATRVLLPAFGAWLGIVAVAFLTEVLWRGLRAGDDGLAAVEWMDGIIVAGIVLAFCWLFLHELAVRPGFSQLAAIGAFWVTLSMVCAYASRIYLSDHYVMQFLFGVLIGKTHGDGGWLFDMFLAVQLFAPLSVSAVRDSMSLGNSWRSRAPR